MFLSILGVALIVAGIVNIGEPEHSRLKMVRQPQNQITSLLGIQKIDEDDFLPVIALITFRIIDTKKPGPVKLVEDAEETLTRPVAIMLDDTVGGLMAGMVVTFFTTILA
jgi:hypothetical protein